MNEHLKPCGCGPKNYCDTCEPGRFDMEYGEDNTVYKLTARIKELESEVSSLDKLWRDNMEENLKFREWQKEAVKFLTVFENFLTTKIENMWVEGDEDSDDYECFNANLVCIQYLIKQAGKL